MESPETKKAKSNKSEKQQKPVPLCYCCNARMAQYSEQVYYCPNLLCKEFGKMKEV